MWVCKSHVKEALANFNAPHFYRAPKDFGIKCKFCNSPAVANMYYAHKPIFKREHQRNEVLHELNRERRKERLG